MNRPVIAFFGHLISGGTPRGALRLFRYMTEALSEQDDIELICLGPLASDPSDPVGAVYECCDGRLFLRTLDQGVAKDSATPARINDDSAGDGAPTKDNVGKLVKAYQQCLPARARQRLRPIVRACLQLVRRLVSPFASRAQSTSAHSLEFPETLFARNSAQNTEFSNADIIGRVMSLDRVDVLLDFWWFHSPYPNPILGRYRPGRLKVVSWFLDAIPLRIPHWQPGLIPVSEYRGHVQAHLESADEIVAISRSAAEDIGVFFPNIRKPMHVIPCGIREDDFLAPHNAASICTSLGLRPDLPTFTFIGFQEPSKNIALSLRALALTAEQMGIRMQAFIIGHNGGVALADVFGPGVDLLQKKVIVVFGGMVSELVKRAVLSQSAALVYPSTWEGFGIPPLEAMAVGTPVVAADIPPLREVCADLAEFCDPYDIDDIARAIGRAARKSPAERADYAKRARQHANGYTWAAAAKKLRTAIMPPAVVPAVRSTEAKRGYEAN